MSLLGPAGKTITIQRYGKGWVVSRTRVDAGPVFQTPTATVEEAVNVALNAIWVWGNIVWQRRPPPETRA